MNKTRLISCSITLIFAFACTTLAIDPLKPDPKTIQNAKEEVTSIKSNKGMDIIGPLKNTKNSGAKVDIKQGAQKEQAGDNIGTKGTNNAQREMAGEQKGTGPIDPQTQGK